MERAICHRIWLLRASGDIAPVANEPALSSEDIEAMLQAMRRECAGEDGCVRALFAWFGAADASWDGVSYYEEVTEKLVTERAVVCDLCSSSFGQVPACVTACPHEAALRVNARFEFPRN